ncbi:unnamed protein product [Effrenium voratum]|uniref:Uncharacterized protein n=1 Tax=Effrenium voratum TaxID=2562239 RepID=A0AA36MTB0_9DINO|nr:unnamed protein product [Effrenium voratum]CAJ1393050.1 unnamed protein product [Effrenium voratum]
MVPGPGKHLSLASQDARQKHAYFVHCTSMKHDKTAQKVLQAEESLWALLAQRPADVPSFQGLLAQEFQPLQHMLDFCSPFDPFFHFEGLEFLRERRRRLYMCAHVELGFLEHQLAQLQQCLELLS